MHSSGRKLHLKRREIKLDGGDGSHMYVYPVLLPDVPLRYASLPPPGSQLCLRHLRNLRGYVLLLSRV